MKSSKKLGVLSFGMLASIVIPTVGNEVHNYENLFHKDLKTGNYNYEDLVSYVSNAETTPDYVYLSDMKYRSAKVGYGSLVLDKYSNGSALTLIVNGSYVTFDKGIFAHATSTIEYDLTGYSDYKYFTTYYGVNKTSNGNGNGVRFYIYTSTDGKNWTTAVESPALKSNQESGFAKIDITGVKYLRLYAHDNGANGNDHSVWADSKLIKEGYSDEVTKSVLEYDELIKNRYKVNSNIDEELELLILQRHIVSKVGTYQLKQIYKDEVAKEAFDWMFNDLEILRLYVMGGSPDGTYAQSFHVLGELYDLYKDDLNAEGVSNTHKVPYSLIYKKMMVTLSLTHSQSVSFWINSSVGETFDKNPNVSVATNRYAIYKKMLLNNKLNSYFEQLEVEEMRYVMNSFINDDEIEWLRDYILSFPGKNWKSSYNFMSYKNVDTGLYRNNMFYGENREQWLDTYKLRGYDVANVKYFPKVFMIMNIGGVCWQISNVGQNMVASYGVPSTMVGQPSHVAYLVYDLDANNNATWSIWNNVSGWQGTTLSAYTGHKTYYNIRLLNGWGNGSYASNNRGSYILLGQAALNDYENYVKSQEKVLLANTFIDTGDKKEADKLLREALEIQSVNFDALFNLIVLHINEKSGLFGEYNEDLYSIAELTAESLKYYPLPFYDMLRYINNNMTDLSYKSILALLENRTLTTASKVANNQVLQADVCRTMASYLLGQLNFDIATFKFDGENGATLALTSMFNNANPLWDYSIDGGNTWITVNDGNSVVLDEETVGKITSANDIKVHLIGVGYGAENIFTIDIKDSLGFPSQLYANDWENKLIDSTNTMEWKYNEDDAWTSYKEEKPNLVGNKKVYVRVGATGVYLPSDVREYQFTDVGEGDIHNTYISIDHLEVADFSSQTYRTGNDERAIYAIDGNANRYWLSNRAVEDKERYITIKLDKAMYLSMLQYAPYGATAAGAGRMIDGNIYISLDGVNWTLAKSVSGLANDDTMKDIIFDEPVYTQYVKIQATKSTDTPKNDRNCWMSAGMINFYTDLTKVIPTAEVEYSRLKQTAMPVTVKLVNPSEEITITNNGGSDTYTFTKNGEFIFEFEDKVGNKGSVKAKVDWIVDYSFAFDGEDPYTIILGSKYDGLAWQYSIDGGNTWTSKTGSSYKLSEEEISSLTATNGLKIKFDDSEETINIPFTAGATLPTNLYGNDWENRILGSIDTMEWRIVGEDTWTSYKDSKPNLNGNVSVEVRIAAFGTTLRSESRTFTFTNTYENDKKYTYVPVEHLEVVDFSSETYRSGNDEKAIYAIDGYRDTFWMTNRATGDLERYMVLKLDEPRYVSKIQYVPALTSNIKVSTYGIMTEGLVYTSKDGVNWTEVAHVTELAVDDSTKDIVFGEPMYAQYIKIVAVHSACADGRKDLFFNAAMFNVFEDKEEEFSSSVKVVYSTEKRTNKDVDVQLVSTNSSITITNNDGKDTYTFTENGEFEFTYVDEFGNEGTYKAVVTWIDKEAPIGTITYSTTDATNGSVIATLSTDEDITITNNDGSNTYTFTKNGEFEFTYVDDLGNVGKAKAIVDWIVSEAPEVELVYSTKSITNKDVVVTLNCDKKITITNNDGKNTYTFIDNGEFIFDFVDEFGNVGSAKAIVSWIDKEAPVGTVIYSTKNKTNQDVIVNLEVNEDVTITNNDGKDTYTFTDNGEFTFNFVDKAGNTGSVTAHVTWIDKELDPVEITYDINKLTNKNVTATLVLEDGFELLNEDGNLSYVFTRNGNYEFKYKDAHGNIGVAVAVVNWIDKDVPVGTITYSTKESTYDKVTVILSTNEKVTITNNGGSDTYTFTKNGEFIFEFVDEAGNKGSAKAVVDWINEDAEKLEVSYNTKNKTNKDVIATLELKAGYKIVNNGGSNIHTFIDNDEFEFEYEDQYGRKGKTKAIVDWIDKTAPTASITYSIKTYTDGSVIVKLDNPSENITITNNGGSDTYIFTKNGEFIFEFVDEAGNVGTAKAEVTWIKVKPDVSLDFSSLTITGEDVVVTLISNDGREIKIKNNNGSNTYIFTENGEFTFEYEDMYGDVHTISAMVDWIDKTVPTGVLEYDINELTNKDVVVTLVLKTGYTITNNNGSNTYTFKENGTFVFEFVDEYGRKGTETAHVTWIDKDVPTADVEYSTKEHTNGTVSVTLIPSEDIEVLNNNGSKTYIFSKNGTFTFEYKDKAGNLGSTTVTVDWIDEKAKELTVTYDKLDATNKEVVATLELEEGFIVTNNGGSNIYTFNHNGMFTFEYEDSLGRKGAITAHVTWIDKEAPVGTLLYDITEETRGNVKVTLSSNEEITILNNGGRNTYIFTENGSFVFEFVDKAGNKGFAKAEVDWILEHAETLDVTYDITSKTNKDVVATLVLKTGYTITNNNGSNTYVFIENGEFKFTYVDSNGRVGEVTAVVDWIDKTAPIGNITYSNTDLTYDAVVATLTVDKVVKITNNGGKNTYTFTENGEFTFEFVDEYGNVGTYTAKVDWIKEHTNVELDYSTKVTTGDDVVVTIKSDKPIKILNNNGQDKYVFKENGTFTFKYKDQYGDEYEITATVDYIDKTAPTAELVYSTLDVTNQDVVVTLINPSKKITILNNNGSDTYTFIINGSFTFEFVDELGNKGSATANVNWIDKVVPTVELKFSTTQLTNRDVIVTLVNPSEEITILDVPDGSYTFKSNGSYTFRFVDKAGNIGSVTANVDWIDKEAPITTFNYDIFEPTNQNVTVTIEANEDIVITNNGGSKSYTFTENGEFTFEYEDKAGNKGTAKAVVDWINKSVEILEVNYDITKKTNKDVTAILVLKDGYKVINNNGSNIYTFTENGTFMFKYEDKYGNVGMSFAEVDWINRVAPTGEIQYSTKEPTNQNVTVLLVNTSKLVTITNNGGKGIYTFTENGEFTFEFVDEYGNKGSATAKVDWISKEAPKLDFDIDRPQPTNQDVTIKINLGSGIKILNNNGSDTITFTENGVFVVKYMDKYGNIGEQEIVVDWIDKTPVVASISYDNTIVTSKNVTATLVTNKDVIVLNNNGSKTFVFTDNGEFTFNYVDIYGNYGSMTAKVYWIKKVSSDEATVPVIKPNETGNTGSSSDNNKHDVDDTQKPDTTKKPDTTIKDDDSDTGKDLPVGDTGTSDSTKEDVKETNNESIDYTLLEKVVIAVPVIGILYYLGVKGTKSSIVGGNKDDEETK